MFSQFLGQSLPAYLLPRTTIDFLDQYFRMRIGLNAALLFLRIKPVVLKFVQINVEYRALGIGQECNIPGELFGQTLD
jgi:hypothetical protein